jgi:uncharacterized protein
MAVISAALITGASTGIGRAFAQALALGRQNLILVARSGEKLQALAADLTAEYGIQVLVIVQDLALSGAAAQIFAQVQAAGWQVDLLVNNAGLGDYGNFAERDLGKHHAMVQLNVTALVELTQWFLAPMRQRGQGNIINISSITAFQPIPYLALYAATKAFIVHFSQALWAENRNRGVHVLVVCPGPVSTDFFAAADMERNPKLMTSQTYEDPTIVVAEALTALAARQSLVITGGVKNKAIALAARWVPREPLLRQLTIEFLPPDTGALHP